MLLVSLSIGFGYALGPLLGVLLELIANDWADWDLTYLSSNTAPGWAMAMLFVVELLLVLSLFEEPIAPPSANSTGLRFWRWDGFADVDWASVSCCWLLCFLIPMNVGVWDVFTSLIAINKWGWNPKHMGLFIAGIEGSVILPSLLKWTECFTDKSGELAFMVVAGISTIFFASWDVNQTNEVILYAFGGVLLLFGAQQCKGFIWALLSKKPSPAWKGPVMSGNAFFYMAGRGTGAFIAPHLNFENDLTTFLACLDGFAIVWILVTFWYVVKA